jgi:hypothetical protein
VSTPEGKVKDQVKKLLEKYGAYWHMPVQHGFGATSLDFIGCYKGRYFGIETKAPGNKPTARQEMVMAQINEAGGAVFVIGELPHYGPSADGNPTGKIIGYTGLNELEAWLILAQ